MRHLLPLSLLMLALVACGEKRTPQIQAAPVATADEPAEDVPPATAPAAAISALAAMPAPEAIGFAGFGPARFGANEEQVRIAWGADLGEARPDEPGGCYYLLPQPRQEHGYRIGFMLEGGRFVRLDVGAADIEAPGGGRIGMRGDEIRRHYAGRVEVQPHKYVQGAQYLRVRAPDGERGVLLFETDAEGNVVSWRIGVPPQVDYVEGCS